MNLRAKYLQLRYAIQGWNSSAWWRAEGEVLSLYPPDGNIIAFPTLQQMRAFLDKGEAYWGDADMACLDWFCQKQGETYLNVLKHRPALFFFYQETCGFFFLFRGVGGEEYLPFDANRKEDGDFTRWIGGEASQFPYSACVSRSIAWEVVQEFLTTQRRCKAIPWVTAKGFCIRRD
ncbi:hypothetical protein LBMAG21_06320 [Armatimonadota bacterium]|nr:hypothetical protein LBMAG21_06320 [Armatimonadota bacterium]